MRNYSKTSQILIDAIITGKTPDDDAGILLDNLVEELVLFRSEKWYNVAHEN
jgi:hypothetical protein